MNTASQESLDLLRKINTLKIGDISISDFFSYHEYSVWSFFQGDLFNDIRVWQEGAATPNQGPMRYRPVRLFLSRCFFFLLAGISVIRSRLGGSRVLLFAPDSILGPHLADFRMGSLYSSLMGHHVAFQEIIHARPGKKMVHNFFARGRVVGYLEVGIGAYWVLKRLGRNRKFPSFPYQEIVWDGFSQTQKEFILRILPKYVEHAEMAAFKMDFFTWFFKILKPSALLAIDDPRFTHELIFAARRNGVPSHLFQHARFDRYIAPVMYHGFEPKKCIAPDFFWTWNEYHQKKLIRLSTLFGALPDRVRVGGKPFDKNIPLRDPNRPIPARITVLMLAERYAPPEEINSYIKGILGRGTMDIVFSLRTDQSLEKQKNLFRLGQFEGRNDFRVVAGFTKKDWDEVDVVIGTSSTFLDELIEAGIPAAVLDTTTTTIEDLAEDGLAEWLTLDTLDRLQSIAHTDSLILKQRQDMLRTTVDFDETVKGIFNL